MNIIVALLCNWTSGYELALNWKKMMPSNSKIVLWDLMGSSSRPALPDYWVIINFPPPHSYFIPRKTVVFEMEPIRLWKQLDIHSNLFLKVYSHATEYNNIEWHLDFNASEIDVPNLIEKTYENTISSVLSAKYFDPGHIKRINFVKYLEHLNVPIDVYGDNFGKYISYKGSLPAGVKNKGMYPYKYHFNAENHSKQNYFTEKITDAILSECLCFYWGCPNISEYIDPRAYIVLDLDNFEHSAQIVIEAIKHNEWEKRIDIIRQEKRKLVSQLNFFTRLENLLIQQNK
jgi:hypothetical protein